MYSSHIDILLVEDSMDDAGLALRALAQKNLIDKVLHLRDGDEALEYLFSPSLIRLPKVILLDLKMQRIGGIELLRKIKANDKLRLIPVVVLTSSSEDKDIAEAYTLGANAYIVKPVNYENFVATVSDLGVFWVVHNEAPKSKQL